MLHEVLLALSGHPSPLFGEGKQPLTDLLSPSEAALLQSIGKLAERHRQLRRHARWIASHHQSIICRAVATSIQQTHLARFQQKILDVESRILTRDASIVGAYDIVPLASVVSEFDEWHRRMSWLWDIACLMQPISKSYSDTPSHGGCSGAALVNALRTAANTGFPDIEETAIALSKVAETAWLRQLTSWLLYGRLPAFGAQDFFIKAGCAADGGSTNFRKEKELLPGFVTAPTASSILFIGKSLHQTKRLSHKPGSLAPSAAHGTSEAELAKVHLQHLSSLSLPLQSAQLSRAVSAVRLSLSQNVLQHLLPMHETLRLLSCLRQYMLLGRGEFSLAVISQVEARLEARQQSMGRLLQQDPAKALQGLSVKDAELQQTIGQVWKTLAREDEAGEDDVLEFACKHVTLSVPKKGDSRPTTSDSVNGSIPQMSPVLFNDLLFPSATSLGLSVDSPLDLFISSRETETYSSINSYLLAIRRAQVRLSDLWRRTAVRRDHPSPSGRAERDATTSQESKLRTKQRSRETRKVWATCSAAIFLISEISTYLEGEVIRESCNHFETWVKTPASTDDPDTSRASLQSDRSAELGSADVAQRDPETLSAGHRSFLAALTYALLLTDVHYTRELRSLLGNLDALIALFNRLLDLQQKLDLEVDDGGTSSLTEEDERRVALELDRARKKVDSDLKSVVNRLRQLDHERIGSARYLDVRPADGGGFEAWKGGGVDRLLMKLEFGRMVEDGFDLV
ncbi:hypothetical protein LTR36_004267 [Oleoguttula mirabilis]|uniref:Spindle pole body component n=1 Tax=Oleoguttula mirabilis TaxID=1507867 RepID=A0AAV9JGR8_9PEZI|nr:hypothetical protein LTR36_004267 [Oleoguttula mirabilis]